METTTIIRRVRRPDVLLVHRFVEKSGVQLSRPGVQEALAAAAKQKPVSLFDIYNTLKFLGFSPDALKTDPDGLGRVATPFITCRQKETGETFIVVENVTADAVEYYSPDTGLVREPLATFAAQWKGVLLTAGGTHAAETDPWLMHAEQEAARKFREEQMGVHEDFLPAAHCDYLIRYAEERGLFNRSEVRNSDSRTTSTFRTSFSAFLTDRNDPVLRAIYRKTAALLSVPEDCIEDLQIVRYAEGQEFKVHFDSNKGNARVHTLLVYLNDAFEGGETYFPEIDLKVKPRQGRMLYFLNRDAQHKNIPFSAHAGLPVRNGIKYGCNIWVRSTPSARGQHPHTAY
ncbi:MAG: hypothetical protein AVDCRST_MAG56-4219 [uncultured Cytophagales bacterium]|uniref:Fe2OG dioxygenase domain-containing protein n=1 Tax=uncultured Cytophagales bacterium TaxID=158755 RepID=A0A6J4JRH0_9SPHI|nr:MAG: hypothetical protein AVDCRST_MAG56-4219 [uncultured Cytophagales bacterium]